MPNRSCQLTMWWENQDLSEVAADLVLSVRIVERNFNAKIGAGGRADATVYALIRGPD